MFISLTNHFNYKCIKPHYVDYSAHDGRSDKQINNLYLYKFSFRIDLERNLPGINILNIYQTQGKISNI